MASSYHTAPQHHVYRIRGRNLHVAIGNQNESSPWHTTNCPKEREKSVENFQQRYSASSFITRVLCGYFTGYLFPGLLVLLSACMCCTECQAKQANVLKKNPRKKITKMRRSSRLASKILNEASNGVPKGSKRTRESSGNLSEPDCGAVQLKTPSRKRAKIEKKPALKTEEKEKKPMKIKEEIDAELRTNKKPKKAVKRVKQEPIINSGAKAEPDVKPSPSRSVQSFPSENKKYIGAHVSISGGLYNAVYGAVEIGAKAFGMFLRSQRQWNSKPLEDKIAQRFQEACKAEGFSPCHILPHGIYLMNCGSPDEETLEKSRNVLVDELKRCEKLGLTLYNFHPGSTCGKMSVEECISKIAESINIAHSKTNFVTTVIENMSCQGNTIGGKFEEIKSIINQVKDKSRVGVCLDTCHTFAAGYDISTEAGYEKVMQEFERIIGFRYLKGIHLNDSKGELGCHLDRHENIGKGKIGKEGFRRIMEDKRLNGIPMILETPCVSDMTYTREIQTLYAMAT